MMTAKEFCHFLNEKEVEYSWYKNDNKDDVIMFIAYEDLLNFAEMLGYSIFDDEGIEVNLKHGYLCIWANQILEYFGIELKDVFEKGK